MAFSNKAIRLAIFKYGFEQLKLFPTPILYLFEQSQRMKVCNPLSDLLKILFYRLNNLIGLSVRRMTTRYVYGFMKRGYRSSKGFDLISGQLSTLDKLVQLIFKGKLNHLDCIFDGSGSVPHEFWRFNRPLDR